MSEPSPSGAQGLGASLDAVSTDTSVELLRRARDGESEALDRLLERYLPPFRAWASRRLPRWARDGLDTDDLVSVWQHLCNSCWPRYSISSQDLTLITPS